MITAFGLIALCVVVFALRVNHYSAFMLFASISSFLASITAISESSDTITLMFVTNITISIYYIKLLQKRIQVMGRSFGYSVETGRSEPTVLMVYFVLSCFIGFYLIYNNPWFFSVDHRLDFLTSNNVLQRFIKILPLILLALMLSVGFLNDRKMLYFVAAYFLFAIFYGSKSGLFFLFMHLSLIYSITKFHTLFTSNARLMYFAFAIIGLFAPVVLNGFLSNTSFLEAFVQRFLSGVGGIKTSILLIGKGCGDYSYFNPLLLFLGKLNLYDSSHIINFSMGNCLAAPNIPDYSYEVLVPHFIEHFILFGYVVGFATGIFSLALLSLMLDLVVYVIRKLGMPYLSKAVFLLTPIIALTILWGGKLINYLISDFASLVVIVTVLALSRKFLLFSKSY